MAAEITVSEIRDFHCCPYIWWFRSSPLSLEQQERLQRLKQEPGTTRARTMPLEVPGTGCFRLFTISAAVAALIALALSGIFRRANSVWPILVSLDLLSLVFLTVAAVGLIRWYRWQKRAPEYLRAVPGEVLFNGNEEREPRTFRAGRYGIAGPLNCVVRQGRKLATMETRSRVTPKSLALQDRMQAVAQALLAEAEYGVRPEHAYVVYPDQTFEVKVVPAEVEQILAAVRAMRTATDTGRMPELRPAWHLCPACPITACPKRIAPSGPEP